MQKMRSAWISPPKRSGVPHMTSLCSRWKLIVLEWINKHPTEELALRRGFHTLTTVRQLCIRKLPLRVGLVSVFYPEPLHFGLELHFKGHSWTRQWFEIFFKNVFCIDKFQANTRYESVARYPPPISTNSTHGQFCITCYPSLMIISEQTKHIACHFISKYIVYVPTR